MSTPEKNDPPKRKHPAHGVLFVEGQPTIIFDTVCTKDRGTWLANDAVHNLLREVWLEADAWWMGRYLIMPDHIHFFAAATESTILVRELGEVLEVAVHEGAQEPRTPLANRPLGRSRPKCKSVRGEMGLRFAESRTRRIGDEIRRLALSGHHPRVAVGLIEKTARRRSGGRGDGRARRWEGEAPAEPRTRDKYIARSEIGRARLLSSREPAMNVSPNPGSRDAAVKHQA